MALLTIRDLSVAFETHDGVVRAGNDVSFLFEAGKVLALLGESGSGKSVTLRAIPGLHPALRTRITGEVPVNSRDVNRLDEHACEQLRGAVVSIVLQEPMAALDHVHTTGEQIAETLAQHRHLDRRAASGRAGESALLLAVPTAPACGSGGLRHGDGGQARGSKAEGVHVDYAPRGLRRLAAASDSSTVSASGIPCS